LKDLVVTFPELRENGHAMKSTLRTLRVLQWTMLGGIVLCAVVGELVGSVAKAVDPSLSYVFTTVGVALVGVIFVVRRTLVLRSEESLAAHPDDGLSLRHWKNGYFATYALCEVLALFGLVLRLMGFNFQQSIPFYIGGFALVFFFGPREPVSR
jgi:cytochrome b561